MSDRAESIVTTIGRINRQYFLPAIQREFIWKPQQIIQLFDSLLRGYPKVVVLVGLNGLDRVHGIAFSLAHQLTDESGDFRISDYGTGSVTTTNASSKYRNHAFADFFLSRIIANFPRRLIALIAASRFCAEL